MFAPLRSANHPIRQTYRSARSALVQENSNKVLKETLLEKIDSPVKKKLFLKCVAIIQSNYSKPFTITQITKQFTDIMIKIFSITIADIETIVSYSKHQSSYFKTFYTTSLSDLLCDLEYSDFDKFSIFPSSQAESLLRGEDLHGLNLSWANLSGLDLRGANLSKANLSKANLRGANLSGLDLRGEDLSGADLIGANLRGANLSKANLSGANLSGLDLRGANLRGANLSKANLRGANLSGLDLRGANLSGLDLRGFNLSRPDLSGLDLRGADLSGADLSGAYLIGANLRGANLSGLDLRGADLSRADLSNIQNLDFIVPTLESDLDYFFNHLANNGQSNLVTINSISDNHRALKIQLMESIVTQINALEPRVKARALQHRDCFMDIFSHTDLYLSSETILNFIGNELVPTEIISKANINKKVFSPTEQKIFIPFVVKNLENKEFCLKNSGFISQLIYSLKTNANVGLKKKGVEIEALYLSHFSELSDLARTQLEQMGVIDEDLEDLEDFLQNNMLLISPDQKHAILITYTYYEKFLLENSIQEEISFDNLFYLKQDEQSAAYTIQTQAQMNLKQIFENVVLFQASYMSSCHQQKTLAFFDAINLGGNLRTFKDALSAKKSDVKFITTDKENELIDIFKHFIKSSPQAANHAITYGGDGALALSLTDEFTTRVIQLFELGEATPTQKAQTFACLSALFTRLTSSSFFGTELTSPLPLRNFAIALLNKAIELDATQVPGFANWKDRLAGINGAFSCTSVLFDMMADALKHTEVYFQIIPPAWQ